MAELSLRKRMALTMPIGDQSVKDYAPTSGAISLRGLLSSFRLIHLSDLHFTASKHTLDWRDDHLVIDTQDSPAKSKVIADFLCASERGPAFFDTSVIVITGDLTDSGDTEDYAVACAFIERLKHRGFDVYVVPGNHDYCKEGNLIVAEILATITPLLPPGISRSDLASLSDAALAPIKEATKLAMKAVFPQADLGELLDYLVNIIVSWPPVTDTVDNHTRRQRFIDNVSHDAQYPRVKDCGNGWLVLLDSMQGQMEGTDDLLAEGKIGQAQLSLLDAKLEGLRNDRLNGKKIAVCLHHSPLARPGIETWTNWLDDRLAFLSTIDGRFDCLLFGHVGIPQEAHDATRAGDGSACMPLGNSENLEPMRDSYPVTVADLGARMRAVFQASDGPSQPPRINWLAA